MPAARELVAVQLCFAQPRQGASPEPIEKGSTKQQPYRLAVKDRPEEAMLTKAVLEALCLLTENATRVTTPTASPALQKYPQGS